MAKKDLANVTTNLTALASLMPTQRPVAAVPTPEPAPLKIVAAAKPIDEEITQISLSLRKELKKQLTRLAGDADLTMRAFVLNALKDKGLDVREDDLADLRKDRR